MLLQTHCRRTGKIRSSRQHPASNHDAAAEPINCVTRDPSNGRSQSSLSRLSAQMKRRRSYATLKVSGVLIAWGCAVRSHELSLSKATYLLNEEQFLSCSPSAVGSFGERRTTPRAAPVCSLFVVKMQASDSNALSLEYAPRGADLASKPRPPVHSVSCCLNCPLLANRHTAQRFAPPYPLTASSNCTADTDVVDGVVHVRRAKAEANLVPLASLDNARKSDELVRPLKSQR
jgi:hypothetical protein